MQQKQGFNVNFGQGLDTNSDPFQVQAGKLLVLENVVFDKQGLLQKRNGYAELTSLPDETTGTLTTLNGTLIATGRNLLSYSQELNAWSDRGVVEGVDLSSLALRRVSASQSAPDSVVSSNGLVFTVYTESSAVYYQISDSTTGQAIIDKTAVTGTSTTNGRAFLLANYFVVTYARDSGGTPTLSYIAIPIRRPSEPIASVDITNQLDAVGAAYDGVVANNRLFIAWCASDVGDAVRIRYLTETLSLSSQEVMASARADLLTLVADLTEATPNIFVYFWNGTNKYRYMAQYDFNLTNLFPYATVNTDALDIVQITGAADATNFNMYYEVDNDYSYVATRTDYIGVISYPKATGIFTSDTVIKRSVGLASKALLADNGNIYMMVAYGGAYQPTYFLMDSDGNILTKLSYQNGAGYASSFVLPSLLGADNGNSDILYCAYLIKTLISPVNKTTNLPSGSQVSGIYAQTGVNLAKLSIIAAPQASSSIADCLHLTGGQLWIYDAVRPVEHSFHLYPEDVVVTTNGAGGLITAQKYFYVFCYEWTDGKGNLHRSAPSVPVSITTTGSTSTNTIKVPTLRITAKNSSNPVRIVGYRWSAAQQTYYRFTSITSPTLNDTSVDSVTFTDTLADSTILGNDILYTTGGVVENIAAPACFASTLSRSRMFVVDAENRNQIWYSKPVLQGTPVEFSDLFTIFVAPTIGAQGSTGPITALASMDDKLIVFKENCIYYVSGAGPDITGANNDFSDPIFITSTVGCVNRNSIVFMPQGIMFQSNKGIWLLGRDLSTTYIGIAVDQYNTSTVLSAVSMPNVNEVRFSLDTGETLVYNYFYEQWATFNGISSISRCIFEDVEVVVDVYNRVLQETPGIYLDGTRPVNIKFTTAWIKLTDLQGFQRAYWISLLGEYLSPHKLSVDIAFDYNPSALQTSLITPINAATVYGGDSLYGGSSPYGGSGSVEQWRVFLNRQKCQAIQITVTESFDSTKGMSAGAGLTLSGINFVVAAKASYPKLPAIQAKG